MEKPLFLNCRPVLIFPLLLCLSNFGNPTSAWSISPDVFPEMDGWKQSEKIHVYSPDTLFDYINGGADLYLKYDFQELKVAEYKGAEKTSIIVEIYQHRSPNNAFGIYSQERPSEGKYLDIGAQGYMEEGFLNFLLGKYYVKMSSLNLEGKNEEVLPDFARKIAQNLGGKSSLPALLASFPKDGKKANSEKFISKNFLGYSFLHSAFTADYELSGKKFKLFILEGRDAEECREMLRQHFQQAKHPSSNVTEGSHALSDPYHGQIALGWKGKYIWGVLDQSDSALRSKYLNLLEEKIIFGRKQ